MNPKKYEMTKACDSEKKEISKRNTRGYKETTQN